MLRDCGPLQVKNYYICASLPQIKPCFFNIITSSGSWSDVFWSQWKNCPCFQRLLNTYPGMNTFQGFVVVSSYRNLLCAAPHKSSKNVQQSLILIPFHGVSSQTSISHSDIREHSPATLFTSQKCQQQQQRLLSCVQILGGLQEQIHPAWLNPR